MKLLQIALRITFLFVLVIHLQLSHLMFKKINIGNKIEDFIELLRIFRNVFEVEGEDPDSAQLLKLIKQPDFLVFVIKDQGRVIGGLTIYILDSYYGKKPQAYIYDVGISPQFQGKGYGKKLISEVFDYCKKAGFEEMYVEAEKEDLKAVEFYRGTNFDYEMEAVHFTYSMNNNKILYD